MSYKSLVVPGTVAESGINGALSSFSFNHTSQAGANQVVYVAIASRHTTVGGNTAVTACTYGGTPMTAVTNAVTGGSGASAIRVSVFILSNPPVGVNSVAITFAGSTTQSAAMAVTFNNIDQTTQQDITADSVAGTSTGTTLQNTVTIERVPVIAAVALNGGGGMTITRPAPFPSANPGFQPTTLSNQDDGTTIELFVFSGQSDIIPNLLTIDTVSFTGGSAKFGHVATYFRPIRRRAHAT